MTASKYRPEFALYLREYIRTAQGRPPSIAGFAKQVGVSSVTLERWCRSHPEFAVAFSQLRSLRLKSSLVPGFAGKFPRRIVGWKP